MNAGTLHHSECEIPIGAGAVILWRIRDVMHCLYPTKTAAEVAARARFPHEGEDARYGRIFYVTYYTTES